MHLAPGEEAIVRLNYAFGRCAQENSGVLTYEGWFARYTFFGEHVQDLSFDLPVSVRPLPESKRVRPASCPQLQSQ